MAEDELERELARRFEKLRVTDDARTPGYEAVLARVQPPVPRRRWRIALVLGAAAAMAILLLRPSSRPAAPAGAEAAAAIAQWKSPTGSLLETPGDELYREPPPAAQPLPRWIIEPVPSDPGAPASSTPARKGAAS